VRGDRYPGIDVAPADGAMGSHAASTLGSLLLAATALHGCALVAVPALGSAAASGSASALVGAGAGSIKGGVVYRTFDASLRDVYAAVQRTLSRLEFPAPEEQIKQEHVTLNTAAIERRVRIDLQPITPALTQVRVTAVIGLAEKDLATATTLVDLMAEALEPETRALSQE
jgi:hypothetical protein